MKRRRFLQLAATAAAGAMVEHAAPASGAHLSLRIGPASPAPGIVFKLSSPNRLQDTAIVTNANLVGVSGWISAGHSVDEVEEVIHVLLEKRPQQPWSQPAMEFPRLQPRRRYRLRIMNATAFDIPVHMPGQRVELTRVSQAPVSVIFTEILQLERYSVVDADLIVC